MSNYLSTEAISVYATDRITGNKYTFAVKDRKVRYTPGQINKQDINYVEEGDVKTEAHASSRAATMISFDTLETSNPNTLSMVGLDILLNELTRRFDIELSFTPNSRTKSYTMDNALIEISGDGTDGFYTITATGTVSNVVGS